jgi:hypothetical protein
MALLHYSVDVFEQFLKPWKRDCISVILQSEILILVHASVDKSKILSVFCDTKGNVDP